MSAALAGSSWNSSDVSRLRINPSCEGTSATSLISCVCTDIFTTLVSGITMLMPGGNADGEQNQPEQDQHVDRNGAEAAAGGAVDHIVVHDWPLASITRPCVTGALH